MENGERLILEDRTESRVLLGILLFSLLIFMGVASGVFGSTEANEEVPRGLFWTLSLVLAFFTWNYRAVTVRLTDRRLSAGYGLFRSTRALRDISSVERYSRPWWFGYGSRYTLLDGSMCWMHNAVGKPLVIVRMHEGKGRPFAFSCDDPARIIAAVTEAKSEALARQG